MKPGHETPTSVRVTSVAPEIVTPGRRYGGVVREIGRATLSFRVSGTVRDMRQVMGAGGREHALHEGDRVMTGAALASIDSADYRREQLLAVEQLAIAEARLAQLETESELAKLELRRIGQLVRRGSVTDAELDTIRSRQRSTAAAVDGARRDVESARIHLEQAEADLASCTLFSPLEAGTVAARYIEVGERVAASEPAFLLLDLSSVVIAFGVPDTVVGRLQLGQVLQVSCEALPGQNFRGIIHKIAPAADLATRTYAVEVRVDDPQDLRPGMIATVAIDEELREFLLPLAAIVPKASDGSYEVFRVAEENGRPIVHRVPVEFEDLIDDRVTVRIGDGTALKAGDRIVATGTHRLYDGQQVQISQ
ncbi:MAG TPA: efflux RND transporter periplasmic adaptor subunit [Pirellulales bacterium]|nr:efflux RND transporter periplasmic adaptor subunit [Pirellulales bacterium]